MEKWNVRPVEVANLLNPAFVAMLLREIVRGHQKQSNRGMDYALAFLAIPICLHKQTREALPSSVATRLHPWLQDHQEVKVGFADRVRATRSATYEGLCFAYGGGYLKVTDAGYLESTDRRMSRPRWGQNSEPESCVSRAHFVGRWFGREADVTTIFAIWGVRPSHADQIDSYI